MSTNRRDLTQKTRKLVVVGDGMAGKTCLLYAFKDDKFDSSLPPTIFETYAAEIEVDGKTIHMALFDTAGQEDYARLRPLSYPDTNVVLICFSVSDPSSLINVRDEWNTEVRHFCGQCPVIIVACKIDLRTDRHTIETLKQQGRKPVTTEEGKRVTAEIKADAYMECSAKTREGVHELFVHAARLSLEKRPHRRSRWKCTLY